MDERALVQRAKQGDLEGFERLLRCYQPDAQRLAYVITGEAGDAEDAVQEGFVKAWRALDRFDPNRPFRPWLLKIVANEARMRRRAAGQRQRMQARLAESASINGLTGESPESSAINLEGLERIASEIELLPEPDQIVLKCRYVLDMTTAEIADALDEPPGTVRSRLSRATEKLRQRINDAGRPERIEITTWKRPPHDH